MKLNGFFTLMAAGTLATVAAFGADPSADKVKWIKEHAVPVRSVDIGSDDFSDLMPLKQAIGDARIVQLGEATHGDGTTFLAKGRLIRFLHEVMGFDVLMWESPMLACRMMDADMRNPAKSPYEAVRSSLYPAWSESTEVMSLFDYIKRSQGTLHPLVSAGVDCRLGSVPQKQKLVPGHLIGFFDRIDPQLLTPAQRAEIVRICSTVEYGDYYMKPGKRDLDISVMKNLVTYLDAHRAAALKVATAEEADFVRQLLVSEIGYEAYCDQVGRKVEPTTAANRDALMGDNLAWQALHRFPDRKIIVWAHNYHVMEAPYRFKTEQEYKDYETQREEGPMGHAAVRKLGKEVYTIGFSGYEGTCGYTSDKTSMEPIAPPTAGTLDWYMGQVDAPYAFLDLQSLPADHWLRQPLTARFYFWKDSESLWPHVYDAVFFSRKMEPSTSRAKS